MSSSHNKSTSSAAILLLITVAVFMLIALTLATSSSKPKDTIFSSVKSERFINNCLFDATIENLASQNIYFQGGSQFLREECNKILTEEGMPIIANNLPAGEQYIQALSKYFDARVVVFVGRSRYTVCHESVNCEAAPNEIRIRHVGSEMNGHWISG